MRNTLVRNLPKNYLSLALIEQHNQGNKNKLDVQIIADKEEGNFDFDKSILGSFFWHNLNFAIRNGTEYPKITKKLLSKIPKKYNLNSSLNSILKDKHLETFDKLLDNRMKPKMKSILVEEHKVEKVLQFIKLLD